MSKKQIEEKYKITLKALKDLKQHIDLAIPLEARSLSTAYLILETALNEIRELEDE